ncbi:MAG: hypothetical protein HUU20_23940, partial [Pirellulales bacterium]|nr:hypothetical protein [Pirellulales bacterium]
MAIDIHTSLGSYAEYVRANDPHAEHRLRLLQEVEGLQSETPARADRDRTALAAKLERWRYQLLNERAGDLRPEDRGLSDALDLAANDLAARPPRPPRAVRASVADSRTDDDAISQAIACLELHVALEDLADHA